MLTCRRLALTATPPLPFQVQTPIHKPPLTPSVHNPPLIPPLSLPTNTSQGQPRQRVVHSILFKVLERPLTIGGYSREVLVEETDAQGYTKSKSLEFFFDGIIGHLRDRWGNALENDSAPSSPITGGIGSEHRRLALSLKSTRCRETNLSRNNLCHLSLPRKSLPMCRPGRFQSRSCKWRRSCKPSLILPVKEILLSVKRSDALDLAL